MRGAAAGLVVGPAAFIGAWLIGGATTPDYSAIDDAISQIAAVGAPRRELMTAGFVVYGVAVGIGSLALRTSVVGRAWWLALVNGVATIAVAATPLDRSDLVDALHGVAATIGYVSIVALPVVAAGPLRTHGFSRAATASVVIGAGAGASLLASAFVEVNGLFQRLGLTAGDVWLVAAGITLLRAERLSGRAACT